MYFTKHTKQKHRGIALIVSMIFVLIFSALAVSLASFSGTNVQIANNQQTLNLTRSSAESGLEIFRYWLSHVDMPYTPPADRFGKMANDLQFDMAASDIYVTKTCDEYDRPTAVSLSGVQINSSPNQSFSAILQPTANVVQMDVTGSAGGVNRTIRVNYKFGPHPYFDYGVATKGPLHMAGNIEMTGFNVAVEADVYIESENENEALSIIGNSQIAGDVKITNPDAYVTLQGGQAGIGGETGQDAIDNHVDIGVPPTEFPPLIPSYFEHYVQSDVDMNNVVHENVRIPAGTNPTFSAGVVMKGIVFIEVPNIVTFSGHAEITGIIVGNGELNDNSGTNRIIFLGTVDSYPVTDLPESEPQFDQLRNETGTFLMAPGFSASFGGNFDTLNGAIAANGIEFFGNAGGIIKGSVINYSDQPMNLSGNSDLIFNRSGITEVPAGFGIIMRYIPSSYTEVF